MMPKEDEFTSRVGRMIELIEATLSEPSSYNRFHINRIKDIIAGRKAYYNETETERRWDFSTYTHAEKLEAIVSEFANMQWDKKRQDVDEKRAFFHKEITSFDKALLWCEMAEIQLVPKGLMIEAKEASKP
jgi:hypothetical protein